jgi:hypothetical protein
MLSDKISFCVQVDADSGSATEVEANNLTERARKRICPPSSGCDLCDIQLLDQGHCGDVSGQSHHQEIGVIARQNWLRRTVNVVDD